MQRGEDLVRVVSLSEEDAGTSQTRTIKAVRHPSAQQAHVTNNTTAYQQSSRGYRSLSGVRRDVQHVGLLDQLRQPDLASTMVPLLKLLCELRKEACRLAQEQGMGFQASCADGIYRVTHWIQLVTIVNSSSTSSSSFSVDAQKMGKMESFRNSRGQSQGLALFTAVQLVSGGARMQPRQR